MDLAFPSVDILGVPVACLDRQGLLDAAASRLEAQESPPPFRIAYANSHCLNLAQRDAGFRAALGRFDLVYADGFGPVLAGRILGGCRLEKLTGADWVDALFHRLAQRGARIFILAGRPGIASRAADHYLQKYPGLALAGTADGFFENMTESEVLAQIRAAQPDVLFVGMGSPRQEAWIDRQSQALPVKICWAVGALFDYAAGQERRAPGWMLALQLEWLWRLLMDPRGKWRRYLIGTPVFLIRVLAARLRISDRQALS